MTTIKPAETPQDFADARDLMREFTSWAITLDPETAASAPTFHDLETELANLPGPFGPPDGCLLLIREGGSPVGCGAFRSLGEGTVEIKRMYLRTGQRGKGLGLAMVNELLASARVMGATRVVLDSHHSMMSAHRVYQSAGFRFVPAPAGFPAELIPKVVFMEMRLT